MPEPCQSRYQEWVKGEAEAQVLDENLTELRRKQLDARRVVREQLLLGRSESFRQRYLERQREEDPTQDNDDPSVFKSKAAILSEDIAATVAKRQRATVVVYGHEGAGMTDTAELVMDNVLNALHATIDAAAKQHDIRCERERKQRDKISAVVPQTVTPTRQDSFTEVAPTKPNPGSHRASIGGGGASGARALNSDRRRSNKRASIADGSGRLPSLGPSRGSVHGSPGRVSMSGSPGPPPPKLPQKRMSLVQRQSLVPQGELPNGRAIPRALDFTPDPGAAAISAQRTKTVGLPEEPPAADGTPQKLPPLGRGSIQSDSGGVTQAKSRLTNPRPSADEGEGEEDPTHPAQMKRQSTIGITNLNKNGRKGCVTCLSFDGARSMITAPPVKDLEKCTRACEIEFWVKSGQRLNPMTVLWVEDIGTRIATLRVALNTNERMEYAENQTLFFLRDNSSNTLAATAHEDLCDGRWHHVIFSVRDALENVMGMRIDGKPCRLMIRTSEGPHNFNGWNQSVVIGGEMVGIGELKMDRHFSGSLADLKIWQLDMQTGESHLRAFWPLNLDPSDPNCVREQVSLQDAEAHHTEWRPDEFPECCLYFNGKSTHVNVGTLQDFGEHMGAFKLSLWMKSDQNEQTMALLKVTDSAHKHAQVGLELNRNTDHAYQKGVTLLSVRDAFGNELTAQQTSHDLCDGAWHEVQWEVNAAANTMVFKVDCFNVELDYGKRDMPGNFFSLNCWMCLGGHNCRGAVQSHFQGYIKDVRLWAGRNVDRQYSVAHWPLDEGVGATLTMDQTGNGNNGIIYDRVSKRRCSTWLITDLPAMLETTQGGLPAAVQVDVSFSRNKVMIACIHVFAQPGAAGVYEEGIGDLLSDSPLQFDDRLGCLYGRAWETPWRPIRAVPESAFRQCESYEEVVAHIQEAMDTAREHKIRSSHIYILRVGEGQVAVVDALPFNHTHRSIWNDKTKEWEAPKVMLTQEDKLTTCLNRKVNAVEKVLMGLGKSPALFRRARAGLKQVGFSESFLGEILQWSVFDTVGTSSLYWVHNLKTSPTESEAASTEHISKSLEKCTATQAAVVVQKSFRRVLAKQRLALAAAAKEEELRLRAHKEMMRKEQPEKVSVRDRRVALVIAAVPFDDPKQKMPYLPSLRRQQNIIDALTQQNWEVWLLSEEPKDLSAAFPMSPVAGQAAGAAASMKGHKPVAPPLGRATKANIAKKLDELEQLLLKGASCVMVHFMGFGAKGKYYRLPTRDELRTRMDNEEQDFRESEEALEVQDWAQITKLAGLDRQDAVQEEESRKAEEKERRRKSKKEAEKKDVGWVSSTKAQGPTPEQIAQEKQEKAEAEQRRKERKAKAKREAEIGFQPSPTPHLAPMPEEKPPNEEEVNFLVPVDCPLEYSEHNTISVDSLVKRFLNQEVGLHAIVSLEVHGAPRTGSKDFGFLGASTGEMRTWTGHGAADFYSIYWRKALSGSGTHGMGLMLKSDHRRAQEGELLNRWKMHCDHADEAGRARPPCPVAKRGATWESAWEYMMVSMTKRGYAAVDLANERGENVFVGDMILADQRMDTLLHIPSRRKLKERGAGIEMRVLFDRTRDPMETGAEVVESITERLQALDASIEVRAERQVQRLVLTFKGDVVDALPPSVKPGEWDNYLSKLFGAQGLLDFRVTAGTAKDTFFCVVRQVGNVTEDSPTFPDLALHALNRITGRIGADFEPNGYRPKGSKRPPPGPFPIVDARREMIYRAAGSRGAVLRLEKMHLKGKLEPMFSDMIGLTVQDYRMQTEGEYNQMEAELRAVQDAKRKEIERRKSEFAKEHGLF
eukprot:Hpha_TRINITY_DN16643_c0_g10::TRINITY_DN16643_c0_g10_i1::g.181891::m.181891